MQDQGKRLLLAVGLALLVMLGWNYFFAPPPPKKPPPASTNSGSADAPAPQLMRSSAGVRIDGSIPEAVVPSGEVQTITLQHPTFAVTFSERDAAIVSWKLSEKKYQHDTTKGELIAPGRGLLLTNFARSSHVIPWGATWKGEQLSSTKVQYTYRSDALEVVKTFTVHPEAYLVSLSVRFALLKQGDVQQQLAVTSYGFQDPKISVSGGNQSEHPRVFLSSTSTRDEVFATTYKAIVKGPRLVRGFRWTGFDHPYLLVAMAADPKRGELEKLTTATSSNGVMQTDVLFPVAAMHGGGAPQQFDMVAYVGPKNYDSLEAADSVAGFSTGFRDSVDLGWFRVIGRPLLSLLQFLYGLVGNWGVAIILLTVLVKAATLYWTTKSMRSMKAMAALGPKMKELQEKYKDDRGKLQQETMALYKHHGVNPLAGCLPIFLQMPIWLALYRMLSSASELYLQPFIPGWIEDLTIRDPIYVLPVLVTVTMFLQTKLQPMTGDSAQQKMMLYGMPLMFGVMGLVFPSGLSVYMLTNTVLSALHSVYMNKFDKKSLAAAAMLKSAAAAGSPDEGAKKSEASEAKKAPDASGDSAALPKSKESPAARKNKKRGR